MKKVLMGLFAVVSLSSFGTSLHPDTFMGEAVTVTKMETVQNLMPVILPGERLPYTIIDVDVMSSGCTESADFQVGVRQMGNYQLVEIVRLQPDVCKAVAHIESIQLRTEAIKIGVPVKMSNPLHVNVLTVH